MWRGWRKRQRRVLRRLDKHAREPGDGLDGEIPVMRSGNLRYEFSECERGTGEGLSIVNRSGNRPSRERGADEPDRAIHLCRGAWFRRVLLRGAIDFTQPKHLDHWDADGVTFLFDIDAQIGLQI